jgi:alginate O-acetyltransferase complex protein AlgJ
MRRVVIFIAGVLSSLLVLPAVNGSRSDVRVDWTNPKDLFLMDPVITAVSAMLYPLGISTDPRQVVVGRDGWLFLSDLYNKTLSVSMSPAADTDHETSIAIGETLADLNALLARQGVKVFRVVIGPNKSTLYPELLPDWAQPVPSNGPDLLYGSETAPFVVDLRQALFAAKAAESDPIYFPTDSHWNALAARAAFRAFAEAVGKEVPDLIWPDDTMLEHVSDGTRPMADLRAFLRLSPEVIGKDPVLALEGGALPTERVDFATGKVLFTGGNPRVNFSTTPEIIRSSNALNRRKVLWLRDSYGSALSPLMAATFSEVMAVHWSVSLMPTDELLHLVKSFKPDYVFVTVVERDARSEAFVTKPHIQEVDPAVSFSPLHESQPMGANDVAPGTEPGELIIQGADPYLVFSIPGGFAAEQARFIALAVACNDGTGTVPVRLYWSSDRHPGFDEQRAVSLKAGPEPRVLDLAPLPALRGAGRLTNLRLDMEQKGNCARFHIAFPVFSSVRLADGRVPP